jgi:hypothetical protein
VDDTKLIKLIDDSPLKSEDKEHWKTLLPKLNEDQKKQFEHSVSAKTEVVKVIGMIDDALSIIEKAESAAKSETPEPPPPPAPQAKPDEYDKIPSLKDKKIEDASKVNLQKDREETQKRLEAIRQELKSLSEATHGAPPPSYTN